MDDGAAVDSSGTVIVGTELGTSDGTALGTSDGGSDLATGMVGELVCIMEGSAVGGDVVEMGAAEASISGLGCIVMGMPVVPAMAGEGGSEGAKVEGAMEGMAVDGAVDGATGIPEGALVEGDKDGAGDGSAVVGAAEGVAVGVAEGPGVPDNNASTVKLPLVA